MGLTGGVVALGAPSLAPLIAPKYVDAAETRVIAGAAVGRLLPASAAGPGRPKRWFGGVVRGGDGALHPVRTVGRPGGARRAVSRRGECLRYVVGAGAWGLAQR